MQHCKEQKRKQNKTENSKKRQNSNRTTRKYNSISYTAKTATATTTNCAFLFDFPWSLHSNQVFASSLFSYSSFICVKRGAKSFAKCSFLMHCNVHGVMRCSSTNFCVDVRFRCAFDLPPPESSLSQHSSLNYREKMFEHTPKNKKKKTTTTTTKTVNMYARTHRHTLAFYTAVRRVCVCVCLCK